MSRHGDPLPLSNIRPAAPMHSVPMTARTLEADQDIHDIDLKGYFNIL